MLRPALPDDAEKWGSPVLHKGSGLGFGVWGSGFRVDRVWGLGF